jgi:hypothetical protein
VTAIAEVPAGVCAGRHIHPGIESGYVLEGDVVLKLEGKPEQTFKAGQWFPNPANSRTTYVRSAASRPFPPTLWSAANRWLCHRRSGLVRALWPSV